MEKQSVLLNITEDAQNEALFMSKTFVNMAVKRRVYVNTLGVESFMQYLSDNGFEFDNLHNIHSITRVVEKADVADILAKNIHIDVRVVFDENEIFIPKTHKRFGLTPDIYTVLKIGSAPEAFEFIGYFKPDVINEKEIVISDCSEKMRVAKEESDEIISKITSELEAQVEENRSLKAEFNSMREIAHMEPIKDFTNRADFIELEEEKNKKRKK